MANIKNLAAGILANAPGTSGTSWVLEAGYGSTMPATPFSLTCTPPGQLSTMGNSEIVTVTARSTDTLTVTRAQKGTTAQDVQIGWPVANGIYAEDIIGATNGIVAKENPTGTKNGANTAFSTASAYVAGSLQVYINGLAQSSLITETTPTTGSFTISPAPISTDDLSVAYLTPGAGSGNADTVDGFHASATPTANNIPVLDSNALMPMAAIARDYIQTRLSGTHGMTSSSAVIPFTTTDISKGSKLTRSGSNVVIGAGVSRVRVTYSLMAESMSSAPYIFSRIRVNTTDMSQQLNSPGGAFASISETKIVNVNPGDTINIFADCGGGSASLTVARQSFMLVEVIE